MVAFLKGFVFLSFLFGAAALNGQAELVATTGLSLMYTSNPVTNPDDGFNSGYHFGLNGRLSKGKLFLEPGVSFHIVQQSAQNNLDPFNGNPSIYLLKFPLQLGYRLIQSNDFVLRVSGGGILSFTTAIENNTLGLNKESVKDAQFGLIVGGGVNFGALSVDVKFEKGIIPFYTFRDYKADFVFISLGISL